tara:strand:- start:626 stop:2032 length:1407 start_codon:yes stop_codon:yes gene_type:complete
MADTQSKVVAITGVTFSEVSFSFDKTTSKLSGIKEKTSNGRHKPVNPLSTDFTKVLESSQALDAYNIAKSKGTKTSYLPAGSEVPTLDEGELVLKYNSDLRAFNNASYIEGRTATTDNYRSGRNVADRLPGTYTDKTFFPGYNTSEEKVSKIFAYPLDINLNQDHMKIKKYKYVRADVNMSKPRRVEKVATGKAGVYKKIQVQGDKLIGSDVMGSIFLPMPKAQDVNATAWGKSELNASGLLALGSAELADSIFSLGGFIPSTSQQNREQRELQEEAKKNQQRGDATTGGGLGVFQAAVNQFNVSIASALTGQELDQDTFLARTGGHVLNPNAEMLFQGPAIRNFNFSFTMIARSQREGREIRNMIRFLKTGMAPKFRNTTFIATPDIFTLEYKNGPTDDDILKTANRFSPGGLALTNMSVDYAPNGYWSAYRDSQPVAVKMDLSFSELRPIYEGDQTDPELNDSVGY